MKAIIVEESEGTLRWGDVPAPTMQAGQVRIRVHATAVNRADLLQRIGKYPPPPGASEILGLEAAGVVDEVAPDVEGVRPGDRVCVLLEGGGYAEQVVVDASMVLPVPDALSLEDAAAVPEAFYTAWTNLVPEGGLEAGQTVLVLAAASGIGTAAVQIARHLGARVVATTSAGKLDAVRALGAHVALDRRAADLNEQLRNALEEGAHVIFDPVGGPDVARNLKLLRKRGTLVLIGLLGGFKAELPLGLVLTRRLRLQGSVLRSRSREEKVALTRGLRRDCWGALADGTLHPVVDRVMPIAQAQQAHDLLASNTTTGKVVLRVADPDSP
ncbi:MAG: NAD(P)H-quinone oxidoreductase [Deltaproteobacteria bacterium]|nr:MAG: NAD(P)H-quinone oxidoreductase [Deltaproteobacteria bacterium]